MLLVDPVVVRPVARRVGSGRAGRIVPTVPGLLVHAVLADVPSDQAVPADSGPPETALEESASVTDVARLHGGILGATEAEMVAAAGVAARVLQHPLLARARAASSRGECRREAPVSMRASDGRVIEGPSTWRSVRTGSGPSSTTRPISRSARWGRGRGVRASGRALRGHDRARNQRAGAGRADAGVMSWPPTIELSPDSRGSRSVPGWTRGGGHQREPSTSASYADSVGTGTAIRGSSGRTSRDRRAHRRRAGLPAAGG